MKKDLVFYDIQQKEYKPKEDEKITFRPGCYGIIENDKNQVLMIIDGASKKWEFPGGGLKIGEKLTNGVIREILEETGYDIELESDVPLIICKSLGYSRKLNQFEHELNFFYLGKLKSDIQKEQNFAIDENILKEEFIDINKLKDLDIAFWHKEALGRFLNT